MRRHCFSIQTDTGEDVLLSVELESDLLLWEKAFQMATFLEVERIQVAACLCGIVLHFSQQERKTRTTGQHTAQGEEQHLADAAGTAHRLLRVIVVVPAAV